MAALSAITLPNNVTYELKDNRVPANAVFTDTTYSAGDGVTISSEVVSLKNFTDWTTTQKTNLINAVIAALPIYNGEVT